MAIEGRVKMMANAAACSGGVGILVTSGYGPGPMSSLCKSVEKCISSDGGRAVSGYQSGRIHQGPRDDEKTERGQNRRGQRVSGQAYVNKLMHQNFPLVLV